MLDARVLALGVFTDKDGVDVVVRRLETGNRHARADVGEEVERAAQREVERDVSFADYSRESAGAAGARNNVLGVASGP